MAVSLTKPKSVIEYTPEHLISEEETIKPIVVTVEDVQVERDELAKSQCVNDHAKVSASEYLTEITHKRILQCLGVVVILVSMFVFGTALYIPLTNVLVLVVPPLVLLSVTLLIGGIWLIVNAEHISL